MRSDIASTAIVIMAKQPAPGKTKTRLVPPLTNRLAADLYEALLRDTIRLLSTLDHIDIAIAISPINAKSYFEQITPQGTLLLPIEGKDIGDCLQQALGRLLNHGYKQAIAINADGPSLPREYLDAAVALLDDHDLVFGPGDDGGYYLVGLQQNHTAIFQDIAWSTSVVLQQSLEKAAGAGLSVALTPAWYDVDTIADLHRLQAELEMLPQDRLQHTRKILANLSLSP